MAVIIEPGQPVQVRDAHGVWRPATAASEIQGCWAEEDGVRRKVHDFPVVWVRFPDGPDGRLNVVAWPASAVRPRGSEAATLVREFHEAFGGQIFQRTPAVEQLRARLTREEANEAREAILGGDYAAIAKELADQVIVAFGTALALGIDLDAAVRAVHASNMTKLVDGVPVMREDGKVLKGPDYREPDLSGCVLDEPD